MLIINLCISNLLSKFKIPSKFDMFKRWLLNTAWFMKKFRQNLIKSAIQF